jgi:anti-sigma regulatory factor (Ser/Thr protein kinase)
VASSSSSGPARGTTKLMKSFRPHPSSLYEVRKFIRDQAAGIELPIHLASDLVLAVSEASANAMLHTSTREIRITWRRIDGCVEVEVRDEGIFQEHVPMPEIDGRGGHGIPLMMALVDEVRIRKGTRGRPGSVVRLVKCVEAGGTR